jgi:UDP-sulfoquinovose synthase
MVKRASKKRVTISGDFDNPRVEREEHYFNAANTKLLDLGLEPHLLTKSVIVEMLDLVERHKDRVNVHAIAPTVQWRSSASTLKTANGSSDASFLVV